MLTSRPVSETVVDAISGELLGGGGSKHKIALNARIDNLDGDLLVAEADNQAVLGGVTFRNLQNQPKRFNDSSHTTCSSPG